MNINVYIFHNIVKYNKKFYIQLFCSISYIPNIMLYPNTDI